MCRILLTTYDFYVSYRFVLLIYTSVFTFALLFVFSCVFCIAHTHNFCVCPCVSLFLHSLPVDRSELRSVLFRYVTFPFLFFAFHQLPVYVYYYYLFLIF